MTSASAGAAFYLDSHPGSMRVGNSSSRRFQRKKPDIVNPNSQRVIRSTVLQSLQSDSDDLLVAIWTMLAMARGGKGVRWHWFPGQFTWGPWPAQKGGFARFAPPSQIPTQLDLRCNVYVDASAVFSVPKGWAPPPQESQPI